MKKLLMLVCIFTLILLASCSSAKYKIEITQFEYKSVAGEPSLRRKTVNEFVISDSKVAKAFLNALSKAEKTNKMYDIEPPMFIVKIFKGEKLTSVYELWLMNKEDAKGILRIPGEQAWYDLNIDASSKLKELLYE